ncbi:MAG: hypothetical protein QMC36_00835, partial [Patescibacteria group bacterium]
IAVAVLTAVLAPLAFQAYSNEGVAVSAVVGPLAKPPIVQSVTPALPVITVLKNSSQNVSLAILDQDSPGGNIAYTVSVSTGAVVPHNGLAPIAADGTSRVDFTYYSPSYKAKLVPVTITLDDQT